MLKKWWQTSGMGADGREVVSPSKSKKEPELRLQLQTPALEVTEPRMKG